MPPLCKQIPLQEWSRVSDDCQDIDATSGQCLEGELSELLWSAELWVECYVCFHFGLIFVVWNLSTLCDLTDIKEEDKNVLQQSTVCEVRTLSFMEKPFKETIKDGHAPSRQPITVCGKPTYDSNCTRTPEPGGHIAPLSENEHPGNTPFRNLMNSSSPSGILPHSCNGIR